MNRAIRSTILLTVLHATVDGLCACCVFLLVPKMEYTAAMALFILYNSLAFLTQPLVGLWFDRTPIAIWQLLLSIFMLVVGALCCLVKCLWFPSLTPFAAVLCFGIGNSFFHVYGGMQVAHDSANDLRHLGIFVSSGALGLSLGTQCSTLSALGIIILLLLICTGLYITGLQAPKVGSAPMAHSHCEAIASPSIRAMHAPVISFLLFLLLIVFLRSFVGKLAPSETDNSLSLFPVLAVVVAVGGKALGGFIARWWGEWRTLTLLLMLTGGCFLLRHYHALLVLAMLLFINGSMPITLHLANLHLPHHTGFAFGVLAAMLPLGIALGMFCQDHPSSFPLLYALIATQVVEGLVLLAMKEFRWQVLSMSMTMNVLTNLPLNLFVQYVISELTIPIIVVLEGIVIAVETLLFYGVTQDWRQSIRYSVCCNAASYFSGLIYTGCIG